MAFGTGTVLTNSGKATAANRQQTTPTRNPLKYIAVGTGATGASRTAAAADTALSNEVESRATGTESIGTVSVTNDCYIVSGTVTATGARAIDEAMTLDASSSGNAGVSATFPVVNLASGDAITLTIKTQFS